MTTVDMIVFFFVYILGVVVFVSLLAIAVAYTITWGCEIPYLHLNTGNLRYLKELDQSGFHPSQRYVRFGYGIAVDGNAKQIFLASGRTRKLYSIDDIQNVEGEFEKDQYQIASTLRITVRDFSTPLFEIKSYLSSKQLRAVYSLLCVLREPKPPHGAET
jgi:hypothetical protein